MIPAGTVLRVGNFVVIPQHRKHYHYDRRCQPQWALVTLNGGALAAEAQFRTVTVPHTQTRVELELVDGSTVPITGGNNGPVRLLG